MKNVVVKVTSEEHGAEVIQAFKDLGVETRYMKGRETGWYYGLFDGLFDYERIPLNSQVITLEELKAMANPYPKVMWVWDDSEGAKTKLKVINEIEHEGIKCYIAQDGNDFYVYRNAKDIEEPMVEPAKMKTPIQEFFEFMEQEYFMGGDLLAKYKEMLEKEKEVMCDFAFDYNDEYCNNGKVPPIKDYYNQTFNTKQK